jgi:hypothetical protein
MTVRPWLLGFIAVAGFACSKHNGGNPDSGNGDGATGFEGGLPGLDGPFNGNCAPGNPQCSNCIDDDHDGFIDGFDPECTGPADNDESSFATGIPGDNKDPVEQDCFFDGNSGAGDDGCNIHVCCLLGAKTVADCPIGANKYDPNACPPPIGMGMLSPKCIANCGKLAPPGCDCFACCKIYDPTTMMYYTVEINPAVAPNCTSQTLSDPTKCPPCVQNTQCYGGDCGGTSCVLCPGEPITDLPPGCNGQNGCPNNETSCQNGMCPSGTYCSNGCCIGVIQ